jgi:hypothetical protein
MEHVDDEALLVKRKRSKIMTEQQSHEGRQELMETLRSTSELITQGLIAAQQRNLQFTQHTVGEAVEVLKSHAEATSTLLQQLEQQEAVQKLVPGVGGGQWMESAVELVRRALSSYEQTLDGAGQTMQRGLEAVENALANLQNTTEKTLRDVEKTAQQTQPDMPGPPSSS